MYYLDTLPLVQVRPMVTERGRGKEKKHFLKGVVVTNFTIVYWFFQFFIFWSPHEEALEDSGILKIG